jgi:hypothetical protein
MLILHIIFIALLVFVIFGTIGTVANQDYKKKPNGKSERRKAIIGAIVFAVILFGLVSITGGHSSATKTVASNLPTCANTDNKCQIQNDVQKYLTDNSLKSKNIEVVDYDGGGYGVYTDYIFNTTSLTATKYTMENYYLMLHKTGENIRAASAFQYVDTQDKYGNGNGTTAFYKTLIGDPDWSKINLSQPDADLLEQTIPSVWSVTQDYSSQVH